MTPGHREGAGVGTVPIQIQKVAWGVEGEGRDGVVWFSGLWYWGVGGEEKGVYF